MNVGIVGAGKVGAALASKLVQAGHRVCIANSRGPATLQSLADETGAHAVSVEAAMRGVAVVILSIPFAQLPRLREFTRRLPDGVVVADTSNYFPVRDGRIAAEDMVKAFMALGDAITAEDILRLHRAASARA